MPAKKTTEKPLTYSQLLEYHHKLVEPRFQKIDGTIDRIEREFQEFRHEVNQRFDFLFKKFEDLRHEYPSRLRAEIQYAP